MNFRLQAYVIAEGRQYVRYSYDCNKTLTNPSADAVESVKFDAVGTQGMDCHVQTAKVQEQTHVSFCESVWFLKFVQSFKKY